MTAEQTRQAELVVIGAGPGGYPAAFEAADRGMQVVLVSDDAEPGGVCLQRGCIPSKALLHIARLLFEAREARQWGVSFAEPKIDLDRIRSWKDSVVGKLTGGIRELCRARGVELIQARARFLDSQSLELTKPDGGRQRLSFRRAVLATGSSPVCPAALALDDPRVVDSTGALELPRVPKRLLVVGGGYIGLELGTVYAALGARVTVVEMLPGLLTGADRDLVRPLANRLRELFEAIHLKTTVKSLKAKRDGIVAELDGTDVPSPQTFDMVLIAVGRRPNSDKLGLENTKVEVDSSGFVRVDKQMRTADPAIWAIGDVAGQPMLAHKATREAKVAIQSMAGEPAEFDNVAIPAVVFTDPEVAWCGLTETEAKRSGRQVKAIRFPWAASGRAQTLARTEGLTKLIFDPETERVLGMGVVGPGAGELIAEGVLAVETAAVARDLMDSIHAHPTLAETIMEAAEGLHGSATHLYRPRR